MMHLFTHIRSPPSSKRLMWCLWRQMHLDDDISAAGLGLCLIQKGSSLFENMGIVHTHFYCHKHGCHTGVLLKCYRTSFYDRGWYSRMDESIFWYFWGILKLYLYDFQPLSGAERLTVQKIWKLMRALHLTMRTAFASILSMCLVALDRVCQDQWSTFVDSRVFYRATTLFWCHQAQWYASL